MSSDVLTSFQKQKSKRLLVAFLLEVKQKIPFEHEPSLVKLHFSLKMQKALNIRKRKEIESDERIFLKRISMSNRCFYSPSLSTGFELANV